MINSAYAGPLQGTDEWYAVHRTHVTASRIASIMGVSDYETPLDVYLEMKGKKPPFEGNEHTRRGTRYEPVIIADWCEQEGKTVAYPVPIFFHPTVSRLAASPDAIITPERVGLLECKFSMSPAVGRELGEEESDHIPTAWLLQSQCQMSVTGTEFVDFAVLLYGRLRTYHVKRHDKLIREIESAAIEFIDRLDNDKPPQVDYRHPGACNALRTLYGLDEGLTVDVDDDAAAVWARRQEAQKAESAAEKLKKSLDAEFLERMGPAAVAWLPDGGKVSRKIIERASYVCPATKYERFFYSQPAKGKKR
jgi:putative phage-type endonuclease